MTRSLSARMRFFRLKRTTALRGNWPPMTVQTGLNEVSKWVGRTGRVLSAHGSAAPETYLSATRAIRALKETWSRHLDLERVLFPRMLCRNLFSVEYLERITATNQAIETQLEAILSAPWPRSPQAGLQSLRTAVTGVLAQLLSQI